MYYYQTIYAVSKVVASSGKNSSNQRLPLGHTGSWCIVLENGVRQHFATFLKQI